MNSDDQNGQYGTTPVIELSQSWVNNLLYIYLGILLLGTILDSVGNALSLITFNIAFVSSIVILILWGLFNWLLSLRGFMIVNSRGEKVKHKKLRSKYHFGVAGGLILLWLPIFLKMLFPPSYDIKIYPNEFVFKEKEAIKHEFRVINHESRPMANVWVQFIFYTENLTADDIIATVDHNTRLRHKENTITFNNVELNGYSYNIIGKSIDGLPSIMTRFAYLDPNEKVGLVFINRRLNKSIKECKIVAKFITANSSGRDFVTDQTDWEPGSFNFICPSPFRYERAESNMSYPPFRFNHGKKD